MLKILPLPLALFSCFSAPVEEPPKPPTPALVAAYEREASVACELLRGLKSSDPAANVFFSPASITAALSMLAEGAKGATASELARVLQAADDLDRDGLRALRADLAHRLRAASSDISWNEANGLWVDDSATLAPETQSALETHHGASIQPADFRTDFDGARGDINGWVKKETSGRIEDLLPVGSVSSMTRFILVNAVHFLGKWEDEFETKSTGDLPFLLADGTETSVPFLKDWRSMPIGFFDAEDNVVHAPKDAALTAFELPYRGGRLSFVGLIPASPTGLAELESRLSAPLLKRWTSALHTQRTDFAMPKLKLEPSYDLVPILEGLGLGSMLDPGTADLGGFFKGGAKGIYVAGAYHSAFLKIDEKGTEAAAATSVVAGITSAAGPPPKVHADRPYLFLITERATGAVLFMGRVAHPDPD